MKIHSGALLRSIVFNCGRFSLPKYVCSPAHPARLHPCHFFCPLLLSPSSPDCRLCRRCDDRRGRCVLRMRTCTISSFHTSRFAPPARPLATYECRCRPGRRPSRRPTRPPTRPPTRLPTRLPTRPLATVSYTNLAVQFPPLRGLGLRGGCPHRGRRGGCTEMGRRQGKHLSPSPLVHPPRRPY